MGSYAFFPLVLLCMFAIFIVIEREERKKRQPQDPNPDGGEQSPDDQPAA